MGDLIKLLDEYPQFKQFVTPFLIVIVLLSIISAIKWEMFASLINKIASFLKKAWRYFILGQKLDSLQNKYKELYRKHKKLQREYTDLIKEIESLQERAEIIEKRAETIQERVEKIVAEYEKSLKMNEKFLTALYSISFEVSSSISKTHGDITPSYNFILDVIQDTMRNEKTGIPRLNIFVVDPTNRSQLKPIAMKGHTSRGILNRVALTHDTAAGYTFLTGETYLDNDISRPESRCKPNPHANRPFFSIICVAIKCGDDTIGVLSITGDEKNSFPEECKYYMEMFATTIAPLLYYDLNGEVLKGREESHVYFGTDEIAAGKVQPGRDICK